MSFYRYKPASEKKVVTYTEAMQKMANYCAYQERCHLEVDQKLTEFKLIPEAREKILLYLLNEDFLNETRFAQSFSRGKFKFKHWGRLRIIKELKMRKISEFNIKKGLQEISDTDYTTSFENYSNKKWERLKNEPLDKAKQKFINYFQYRGWENQLIFDKLKELTQ
jgi:regulatory protein